MRTLLMAAIAVCSVGLALPATAREGTVVVTHGMFDNLFGVAPEGGDSRGRLDQMPVIVHVMAPTELEGLIKKMKATILIDQSIIRPEGGGDTLKTASAVRDTVPRYVDKVLAQLDAGNYPLVMLPAGHMSVGGSHPA